MFKNFSAALALSLPLLAHAATDIDMRCGLSVRDFFAPLVQQRLIMKEAYSVAESSVNHFRPNFFAGLSAHGMKVTSVFGYTNDPLFFKKRGNPDQPMSQDIYGVVVKEGLADTQAQLAAVGATGARAMRIDTKSTAILCEGVKQ